MPRFGDVVVLGPLRYRVIATAVAPQNGYWIRPMDAAYASRDRFVSLPDWSVLCWDRQREQWEAT
jgi:hypothetical protein